MQKIQSNRFFTLVSIAIIFVAVNQLIKWTDETLRPRAPIEINNIEIRSDGTIVYDRSISEKSSMVWTGRISRLDEEGRDKRICAGGGIAPYKPHGQNVFSTEKDARHDVHWIIGEDCPLPLPVGADVKFTWTQIGADTRPQEYETQVIDAN